MKSLILQKILSRVISQNIMLDDNIPLLYLLTFSLRKTLSLFWGVIRFRRFQWAFVDPSSIICCPSKIAFLSPLNVGRDCYIDALSKDGIKFGKNVSVGFKTTIIVSGTLRQLGNGINIGHNVGLGSHGFFGCGVGRLSIGNDCIFGNYVSIHPENHVSSDISVPIRLQGVYSKGDISIGNNCWIGAKATILDGSKIGNGCIVAAGAVVNGVFPDNVVIGGVPAKIIKYRS